MAQRTGLSKKMGAASPEAAECAFCGARESHPFAALSKCTQCKVTSYCSMLFRNISSGVTVLGSFYFIFIA